MSHDGQKYFVGERIDLKIQGANLFSQNNANTRFYLSITVPNNKNTESSSCILIVSGVAYKHGGSGASNEKTSCLDFLVPEEKNAQQLSKYLNTPILYRKHPQHNVLVSFSPTKEQFKIGEEVSAVLQVKNIGKYVFSFNKGGRNRAVRDNQYTFSAHYNGKQVEDIGSSSHFGGMYVKRVLKPGEVFEDTVNLRKWFALDKAGMYEVLGSYYMEFNDPESDSGRIIWEDFVSADFIITISE
jgi:hypothetical protein